MPRTRTYGLDIDTIRYAQRVKSGSGTTILTEPLKQINKFVIGVKKLGLWNSMVCWPMRGIHNAGTGSTVYSLGGLGTYNGTMVNSPTWNFNGINYDGVNDGITTTFTLGTTQVFCGVVGDMDASGTYPASKGNFLGGVNSASPTHCIYWVNPRSGFGGEYRYGTPSTGWLAVADNTTTGVHMWSVIGGVGINTRGFRSLTSLGTTGGVGVVPSPNVLSSGLVLGRGLGSYRGTAAFSFIVHTAPSSPELFYTLYKRTLGIGLNLP